ncbi:MAG TPA: dihydropteroate synthase, partial [Candidatus Methylomirabilis sp.]|nr:dihydropteroate synthase [Candidatus Methylomirabilis sp.]
PVSADTSRLEPARAAIQAGARIINDVTGLTGDPRLAALVARSGIGLILMASERRARTPTGTAGRRPVRRGRAGTARGGRRTSRVGRSRSGDEAIDTVTARLAESLAIARAAGISPSRIAVDPGIGFFRAQPMSWHEWDCAVLARLHRLRRLGRPVCVGVSRKSFIGAVAGVEDPARRLPGSLAAVALAVREGSQLIRTHDVEETIQAVTVAEAIRRAAGDA